MGLLQNIFKEKTPIKEAPSLDKEFGDTGTTIYGGIISGEEYNPDLSGTRKYSIYDRMRKGDATIAASLKVLKLPLRSANWYVKPANDDKLSQEQAKFIEHNLKEAMTITWDDFLRSALLMLDYGVYIFEKVFTYVEYEGKTYIGWKKFASRHPKTVNAWQMSNKEAGIRQQRTTTGEVDIPMEKLLIFTNEKEGDNWEGISILRSAYKHWFFKDTFEQIDAMAFERQGLGVPYCKIPAGANEKDKSNAKNLVQNLRANEKAYVVFPEGYEVGFLDMKGKNQRDPENSIAYHNRQIVLNVLAQFLMLGSGGEGGSYALSEDQSDFFYDSLQSVAKNIKDVVNKYAIRQLCDINWPGMKQYPTLEYDNLGSIDKEAFSTMINTLVGSNIITADEGLEDYIRKELDFPELSEEAKKLKKEQPRDQKPAQARELGQKKNLKALSEEFRPYREYTFAERKVNFGNLQNEFNRQQNSLEKILKESLKSQKDKILEQFKEAIDNSDYVALQNIKLEFRDGYQDEIFGKMKELYNFGKNTVASEMKVTPPASPKEGMDRMMAQAMVLADDHATKIMTKAKMKALDCLARGMSTKKAMGKVTDVMDEAMDEISVNTASIITGGAINSGRRLTQAENNDEIYAVQRSELLDEATCNFCLSMDGRTVSPDDPWVQEDEFHSNCRGIWVEILKDEQELPEIEEVPTSIEKNYEGVNDFKQLKTPKVDKDSPAADLIKEEYAAEIESRKKKIEEYESSDSYPDRVKAHKKAIATMQKVLKKLK